MFIPELAVGLCRIVLGTFLKYRAIDMSSRPGRSQCFRKEKGRCTWLLRMSDHRRKRGQHTGHSMQQDGKCGQDCQSELQNDKYGHIGHCLLVYSHVSQSMQQNGKYGHDGQSFLSSQNGKCGKCRGGASLFQSGKCGE
jgi:hypothetical protein